MNMIFCNASCKHQKDGYCVLENAELVSNNANKDCCFFEPVEEKNEQQ